MAIQPGPTAPIEKIPYYLKSILIIVTLLFFASPLIGQEEPRQKSPIELAQEQSDKLQRDLGLNDYQLFLVDSTLQTNIAGVAMEFEKMKRAGMQSHESYKTVAKKWQEKTEASFVKIFTIDQFERYLRILGLSKKARKKRMEELKEAKGVK